MIYFALACFAFGVALSFFSAYLLFRIRTRSRDLNWITLYIIINGMFEIASGFLASSKTANIGLVSLLTPLEIILIGFTVAPWLKKPKPAFVRLVSLIFVAGFLLARLMGWEGLALNELNSTSRIIEVFLLVLLCIFGLRDGWEEHTGSFFRHYQTWFLGGILVYSFAAIAVFGAFETDTAQTRTVLASINVIFNAIKYLAFAVSLVLLKRAHSGPVAAT
ncbi:MAG TPA: hypothetical protein PKV71_15280 [Calditrichia bacterium]|nr:hypothetical protein [Calditrichota bacterium]HQU71894.1 hypothetical protein [Calditrichia bacterium]HQV33248.1 hypothetical protein [Calditrichia bacterium]